MSYDFPISIGLSCSVGGGDCSVSVDLTEEESDRLEKAAKHADYGDTLDDVKGLEGIIDKVLQAFREDQLSYIEDETQQEAAEYYGKEIEDLTEDELWDYFSDRFSFAVCFPEELVNGYDEEYDDTDLSEDSNFILISDSIKGLLEYFEQNNNSNIQEFSSLVEESLDSFCYGEKLDDISFSFDYSCNEELRYLSIEIEENMITVSSGGSVYTPGIGHDSYTDWILTFWCDGNIEGRLIPFKDIGNELIDCGAKLTIELPDEYANYEENI